MQIAVALSCTDRIHIHLSITVNSIILEQIEEIDCRVAYIISLVHPLELLKYLNEVYWTVSARLKINDNLEQLAGCVSVAMLSW